MLIMLQEVDVDVTDQKRRTEDKKSKGRDAPHPKFDVCRTILCPRLPDIYSFGISGFDLRKYSNYC